MCSPVLGWRRGDKGDGFLWEALYILFKKQEAEEFTNEHRLLFI